MIAPRKRIPDGRPLVSVGMPVCNGMPFLPEAVDSVLGQSLENWELIILENGSTDSTNDYLQTLTDPRIRVLHAESASMGKLSQRLLDESRGEFFARLDADDVAESDRLSAQVGALRASPEVVLLGTQIRFLCETQVAPAPRAPLEHDQIVEALLAGRSAVCHSSIMIRLRAARDIGGYRDFEAGEELDFFLRMAEHGRVAACPEKLVRYRLHMNSAVGSRTRLVFTMNRYAIECARARRAGRDEPGLSSFLLRADHESRRLKYARVMQQHAAIQYRRALLAFARGERFKGILRLGASGMMDPRAGVSNLGRRLKR